MVFDAIENLDRYDIPLKKEIGAFLDKLDSNVFEKEVTQVMGQDLMVRPGLYETFSEKEEKFEVHKRYMDLQYVLEGQERMDVASIGTLTSLGAYDEKADYEFFTQKGLRSSFIVKQGEFAVFWPGEAHCPGLLSGLAPSAVKKLIFKIRMS